MSRQRCQLVAILWDCEIIPRPEGLLMETTRVGQTCDICQQVLLGCVLRLVCRCHVDVTMLFLQFVASPRRIKVTCRVEISLLSSSITCRKCCLCHVDVTWHYSSWLPVMSCWCHMPRWRGLQYFFFIQYEVFQFVLSSLQYGTGYSRGHPEECRSLYRQFCSFCLDGLSNCDWSLFGQ